MATFDLIIPERDMRVVKISEDAPVDKWFTGEPPTYAEFVRDTPPELRAHPRVTWSPPVDGDFYGTIFSELWEISPIGTVFRVEMIDAKPEFGGDVVYLNFVENKFDPRVIVLPANWFTTEHFEVVAA